ncbi:hypothetical protein Q4567_22110 [Aliiglaciecola sp. 2_MG-2023]|uniref:hypothetical protein n=1 Tax=unclassified Aliiglaciecola TaxID=2593648 RepID=UPI0026E2EC66|nr:MULTISPECIES: hypothetical protein [unclassified Aliiglaciecola]MDO6713435.1 hypothetical protein [Aliiglaciecola sp. 2_MG-2023]MDO6754576.1 hypothetical protein [Aliiglaciecola sp. 1_MG-2023]
MRFTYLITFVILLIVAGQSRATEGSNVFGSVGCSLYNINKNEPNWQYGYKNWWAGYLTGTGVVFNAGKSPDKMPEGQNFILDISSYCNLNPNSNLKGAIDTYIAKQVKAGYAKLPNKSLKQDK